MAQRCVFHLFFSTKNALCWLGGIPPNQHKALTLKSSKSVVLNLSSVMYTSHHMAGLEGLLAW